MSTDHQIHDQNLSFLMQLHAAVRNVQLYPAANPQVDRAVDSAYSSLKKLLALQDDGVVIAESNQKLLINGQALQDKDLHRPQVVGIIEFITGFEVHSITFLPTINRHDFKQFIELFSETSTQLNLDNNLKELIAEKKIKHISVDTRRYVAIHDGQEVVNGNDRALHELSVSDDELALFVSSAGGTGSRSDDSDQFNTVLQMVLEQLRTSEPDRDQAPETSSIPSSPLSTVPSTSQFPGDDLSPLGEATHKTTSKAGSTTQGLTGDPLVSSTGSPDLNISGTYGQLISLLEKKEGSETQTQALAETANVMASLRDEDLEWLFTQPINKPVTEKLYTRTLKELDKETLIRVAAGLKHKAEVLGAKQDLGPGDKGRVVKEAYMRLLRLAQEKNIEQSAARQADAKLIMGFQDLPDNLIHDLKERLQQPEWSSAVLLAGIENLMQQTKSSQPQDSIRAFSKALAVYDSVLVDKDRNQVVKYAATKMAEMDDGKLEWFFQQPADNSMAEELYESTFKKLNKETLIRIASHLKLQADLQNDNPGQDVKGQSDGVHIPKQAYARLLKLSKTPELDEQITRYADAGLLGNSNGSTAIEVARQEPRFKDPEWSSSVLLTGVEQLFGQSNKQRASAMKFSFTNTTEAFDQILDDEEKEQLAKKAGADLATMDDKILGLLLVQRYKGVFGEKLYTEVVKRMSDDKFEQLAKKFDSLSRKAQKIETWKGGDTLEAQQAYARLMQTVRGEKMRAVMNLYKKKEQERRRKQLATIKQGVKDLIKGRMEPLLDPDVSEALPSTILRLIHNKKFDLADSILDELLAVLDHQNTEFRQAAALCLVKIVPHLTKRSNRRWLEKICSRVDRILQNSDPHNEPTKRLSKTIQQVIRRYILERHYGKAEDFLFLLEHTKDEKWADDKPLVFLVDKTLAGIASHDILTRLLDTYLHNKILRKEAGGVLASLGKQAAEHLLKALERSDNKTFRMRLIHLLSKMRTSALQILLDQLRQDGSWYFKRNILRLLGAVGDESCVEQLTSYLSHDDLRVQRETLVTINAIGGRHRRRLLLSALKTVPDPLKVQVVTWLGDMQSDNLVYPLIKLLENKSLFSSKVKEELQESICHALGRIGSPRAKPILQKIIRERPLIGISGYSERVREAAGRSLEKINILYRKKREVAKLGKKFIRTQTATTTMKREDIIAEKEREVFHLAEHNEKEKAKQMLFDLIISCARQKDFQNAERLRDKLYEVDAMALTEIIKAGEIIEQEKTDSIASDELETWKTLYEELTTEEFNAVFQNLEKKHYTPEQAIINQGANNEELLFINKGAAKVFYRQDNRDIFIKNLGPGDLAAENFFESSTWTVSLAALTAVDLAVLNRKILPSWQEKYPGLESKLQIFCRDFTNVHGQLNKKGLNRRAHERYNRSPKIKFQMCDQASQSTGRGFRGELADISQGGLAFLIRIAKKDNARLLLGRTITVAVPIPGNLERKHEIEGYITAVQSRLLTEGDYSIHVCFNELLSQAQLMEILG